MQFCSPEIGKPQSQAHTHVQNALASGVSSSGMNLRHNPVAAIDPFSH